jgi:signal peptidase II
MLSILSVKLKQRFQLIQISLLSPAETDDSMARTYFRNSALFFSIWLAVMVIYSVSNRVTDLDYLWKFFLLPGLFLAFLAALATFLGKIFRVKKGINWIFLAMAVAVDQGIKAYLFSLEWESISMALVEPVFFIEPTHNTLGSYLWVLLKLKQGSHLLNMILFTLVGFVIVEMWRFYVRRKRNSFWINGFIHLFLAGLLANLIDNGFRGGSLDYITIKPFYTFDLKDLYITLCELFLITELIDNHLLKRLFHMPKEESRKLNQEFIRFVKNDLKIKKKNLEKGEPDQPGA